MNTMVHPIFLTEEACTYLSDALEPLTREEIQKGKIGTFVLVRKNEILKNLVRHVLETELSNEERLIAQHLFIAGDTVLETARRCACSRSHVQTLEKTSKAKLKAYLKYPFLLDFNLTCPQTSFLDVLKEYGGNL